MTNACEAPAGSLNSRVKLDATLALSGHLGLPIYAVFLYLTAFALLLLLPEAARYVLAVLFPERAALAVLLSGLLFLLLLFFFALLFAPFSYRMDCYYDRIAAGTGSAPMDFTVAKTLSPAVRQLKLRIFGRFFGRIFGFGLLISFITVCAGMLFAPKATLAGLPDGFSVPPFLLSIGTQPLPAVLLVLLDLAIVWWMLHSLICSSVLSWLAPVLLSEGRVQTASAALQQSRRLLTPHRAMLRSFVRSCLPAFLSCVLILPAFFVLPKYHTGKALLCRYCLSSASDPA